MSEVDKSPSKRWTKPCQVMKVRMKKRQRHSTSDLTSQASPSDRSHPRLKSASQQPDGEGNRSGKRRNPFGCGGGGIASRRRVQTCSEVVGMDAGKENEQEAGRQRLFSALDSQQDEVFNEEASQRLTEAIKSLEKEDVQGSPTSASKSESMEGSSQALGKPHLTADWCLRTRLRFTSQSSFGWCQPIRMKEEARGLSSFVQGQHDSDTLDEGSAEESRWRSQLQQATMSWMHPNLPWLSLFPRIVPEPKTFKQSVATKDPAIGSALMASWSESFRSIFHLLRSGHCPYFYLCTHNATVLFRGAGLAALPHLHALLSPTTRGLREALKTEGIAFTMPLNEGSSPTREKPEQTADAQGLQVDEAAKKRPSSKEDGSPSASDFPDDKEKTEQAEEERDEEEDEEDNIMKSPTKASSWLQSMGLDRTNFPSLEPSRVKFQTDQLLKLDNRPQSLVLIEGSDTQALYNFLLNSRTVVTSVGPLADIPPTILAPMAFKGATLNSCKLKSGVMKQQSHGALEKVSTLEVSGPLLPHNIYHLCTLLRSTQGGAFHLICSNHDATAPFTSATHAVNAKSDSSSQSDDEIPSDMKTNCGLSESQVKFLGGKCLTDGVMKETVCRGGLYS